MADLRELYQETILDHSRKPRNFHKIDGADRVAAGHNPLCGDRVTLYLKLDGDRIADASFEGQGCAISKASASLMTDAVKGLPRAEADRLFDRFHELVTQGPDAARTAKELGKLAVFAGVSEYPIRVKCATLAWHTLRSALAGKAETVTTEA